MKRTLGALALLGLFVGLTACDRGTTAVPVTSTPSASTAGTASAEWTETVAALQLGWPLAKAAINADLPTQAAAFAKQEAVIDAEVAALSGTTAPTGTSAVFTDLQALLAAVPTSALSASHQAELQAALALSKTLASF